MSTTGRPGHNGGGRLKTGNTVRVGRKKDKVLALMVGGIDAALSRMIDVAKGVAEIETVDGNGKVTTSHPTFDQSTRAFEVLCRYAVGTRSEVTGADGAPLIPDPSPAAGLSKEKLLALEKILTEDPEP